MQAVKEQISQTPRLIVFPTPMGAPDPIPPQGRPQDQGRSGHDPVIHGSKAAIAAAIFAGLAMIGTFATAYVNWSNRSDQKTQQAKTDADTHTNSLVDAKLNPAVKAVNDHTDEKIGELASQIHALDVRIARLEGPLASRVSTLEHRADQQASLAKLVLSDLQRNLNATDRNTPGYWPAAAEFITYRSQVSVGTALQTHSRPDMPNCTDNPPTPMGYRMTAEEEKNSVGPNPNQFIPALYENCRFVLDSPEEAARVPYAREGRSFLIKFKNCQIIYNGGIIAVFNPHPRISPVQGRGPTRGDVYIINGQRIEFENCLFLFSIKTIPPQDGQSMTRELLAQSGPLFSYGKIKID
jgi:hypothetical protein